MLLFALKAFSLFLLMVLLINPLIEKVVTENEKPILTILVDNSKSISFFKEDKNVNSIVSNINNDDGLKDKFALNEFAFGADLQLLDSLERERYSRPSRKTITPIYTQQVIGIKE